MKVIDGIQPRRLNVSADWLQSLPYKPARWRRLGQILMWVIVVIGVIATLKPAGAVFDLAQLIRDGRYLVVFQNNTELRPSGGFPGSFAVIDIRDRQLKNYWFETNIYKADNEFTKHFFVPQPEPIEQTWPGRSLAFNSSNWPIDFFESASSMRWFYETEYRDKIDGLIAVNATVMVKLLNLTGPIQLPRHHLTVTSDNFLKEIQSKVEKEYFETAENLIINEPKTVLKDLMAAIITRFRSGFDPQEFWDLVSKSLDEKDIQLAFFSNHDQQAIAERRNWAGRLTQTRENDHYIAVNNANLNGGKGSLGVSQKVIYRLEDGDKDQWVSITIIRTNRGRTDGWDVGENRNFTRLLVPFGSQLTNLMIDGEPYRDPIIEVASSKTSIGFWFTTPLHETKIAQLRLRLPFGQCKLLSTCSPARRLVVQKQSGTLPDQLEVYRSGNLIYNGLITKDTIVSLY